MMYTYMVELKTDNDRPLRLYGVNCENRREAKIALFQAIEIIGRDKLNISAVGEQHIIRGALGFKADRLEIHNEDWAK